MTTRREFMATAGGIALGAALAPSALASLSRKDGKKMKILILGGTGFLGPHIVNRAVANGHEMTLFNRGRSGPDLFPDLEHIEGDRYTDLSGLEKAVADGRRWDAVIDTFTYVPKTVTDAMDILLPAMDQFIVISTVSVYASNAEPDMDETAAVATVTDETAAGITTHREVGVHYGAMKARVEQAAMDRFRGKVNVIRPGLIVGPRDTTGRYTYWPVRGAEGGAMLAPGSGNDYVQIVDVRDLGDFTVHCAEQKHMGIYNAVSPARARTMKNIVDAAIRTGDAGTKAEWVDTDFLTANGVQPWQHMPAWVPPTAPGYAGIGQLSTKKSIAAGLTTRSLEDTNRATLEYVRTRQAELRAERGDEEADRWATQVRGGIPREREAEVLEAWNNREP